MSLPPLGNVPSSHGSLHHLPARLPAQSKSQATMPVNSDPHRSQQGPGFTASKILVNVSQQPPSNPHLSPLYPPGHQGSGTGVTPGQGPQIPRLVACHPFGVCPLALAIHFPIPTCGLRGWRRAGPQKRGPLKRILLEMDSSSHPGRNGG